MGVWHMPLYGVYSNLIKMVGIHSTKRLCAKADDLFIFIFYNYSFFTTCLLKICVFFLSFLKITAKTICFATSPSFYVFGANELLISLFPFFLFGLGFFLFLSFSLFFSPFVSFLFVCFFFNFIFLVPLLSSPHPLSLRQGRCRAFDGDE